jgi:hypothetical protein
MNLKRGVRTVLLISSLLGGAWAVAQDSATQSTPTPSDNTKVNQRDQNANEPTADQQKDNRSDRDITQQIRRSNHEGQISVDIRAQREGYYAERPSDSKGAGAIRR